MWEPFQWPRGSTPPDRITTSPPTLYRMSDDRLHKPSPAPDRPEQYCLKWNNHSSNLVNAVCDQLYITQGLDGAPFADVTIVCDDGVRLHAHRLILAASSTNFHDIFKSTSDQSSANNSHSYVLLKDIESADMKVLLEYMYKGEVTVAQSQLNRLLNLAKSLQVRGLTGDLAEKAKPSFSDRSTIRETATDLHPQELTVSKRWAEQTAVKVVADTNKVHLASEPKVFSSPLDSKFSLPISESLKEKLRSRSSTPVSRSHSPPLAQKYLKEEVAIKSESDTIKTEPDHQSSTQSHPARSRSPSTCPTSPTYPKQSFEMNRDSFQSLQQSYRSNSPPHHQPRINLETSKNLLDYSRNALFMDQQLHHSISKPLAPSPYSDDEMFLNQRDISPPPSLHQTATSALNLRIPHSTTSPPSPPSPSKRKRFPPSLLPSGGPPPSLLPAAHPHYPGSLQLGNFGLAPFPMFPMGYPHLDNLIGKSSYPDVALRGLSVKKDLLMIEDEKPASAKRQKLMENGPGFKEFDVNNYLKMSSTPDSFRRHSPSTGHQFDKRSDGASPTSTSNLPVSNINTPHSSLLPVFSSNSSNTTNSSAHHNSSASIHTNNSDSPYPHHPRADSYTTNGPSGESATTGASGSANSAGNSNGSSASHTNTNGGSTNSSYNGQFVNYVGGPKPEWKRYKQYSKSDLMMAIEEVKGGMTALQASRKYKVPSRTLYDKIKKLGITTTPRRNISTGGSNNKLRNHHVKSDYNIHGINVDRQDGGVGDHSDSVVIGSSSGGGLVSETGVGDSPMTSCLAGSSLKADSLMRYDSSRPHSVESSATNDSFHPLDLQVSKATANDFTAKLSSASASAAELYSKFPMFKSHVEQLNRYQMESGNRYPHELNSDSRLHHPFAPKSILDMLPRQVDAPVSESLQSALTDNDPADLSKRYEYLEQFRAQMGLIQCQVLRQVKGNDDSHETSQSNSLERQQHSNDGNHQKGDETDDSEIVVDTSDEQEKKGNSSTEHKTNDIIEDKKAKSEFRSGSLPFVPGERNDNDTAYISHSTSAATGPSSSDSPPSSSFTMADSGHDSNNDTSTTSDNEGRHLPLGGIKIKHPKSSPEVICAMTSRPNDISPKASETSISGSEVSPIISDKGPINLDSDSEIGAERSSKTTTGSYKVVSDIGLCSQVRPLDLRETSVAMSIPQESV